MVDLYRLFKDTFHDNQIVITDKKTALPSTTGYAPHSLGKLYPESVDEIQSIINLAREHNLKLYPVSSGKNWGYSDDFAVEANSVIVELSRLNKIKAYDKTHGIITVEPGVTQAQLRHFLDEQGGQHIISPTGSSPHTSIIGNYLERGFGLAPELDHAASVTDLKAILADGSLYQSRYSSMSCQLAASLYKHDLGADLKSLFFQSPLAIVSEMSFRLSTKPESAQITVAEINDPSKLPQIVDRLRILRQEWDIPSLSIKLFNQDYTRAGASATQDANDLKSDQFAAYSLLITATGPTALTKSVSRRAKKLLSRLTSRQVHFGNAKFKFAQRISNILPTSFKVKLKALSAVWDLLHGRPTDQVLAFAYWKKGKINANKGTLNPQLDGCGIIWYAPIIPMEGDSFTRFIAFVTKHCAQYDIPPVFNSTNYSGTYFISLVALLYDTESKDERLKAQQCYKALYQAGLEQGFTPYRLPNFALKDGLIIKSPLLGRIKHMFDPHNILATNHYE